MKIIVLCESISSNGGAMKATIKFIKGLAKKNNKIVLYTTRISKSLKEELQNELKFRIKIVNLISNRAIFTSEINIAIYYKGMEKSIISEKPDLIYSVHPTLLANSVLKIAKKHKIPFVSHVHADINLMKLEINFIMKYFVNKLSDFIANIYSKSDYVIYPTESTYLRNKLIIKNKRYSIISNGVDLSLFKPIKRKENKIKKIIAVGRLIPLKNFDVLIKAVKGLPVKLTIIGDGKLKTTFKAQYPYVNYIEKLSYIDLAKKYQESDLFVLPSIQETESLVALEAIAAGLPIIVSNHENNAGKMFVKDNGYLFQYNSSEDLKEKIKHILSSKELQKKMSKASLELSKDYSLQKSIDKLDLLFRKIVKKH